MKITVSGTVFTSYDVKAKNNSKNEISAIFENWDSGESFGYNVEEIQLLIDLLVETKTKMVTLKQTEKLSNDQQQTERPVGESNPNPS